MPREPRDPRPPRPPRTTDRVTHSTSITRVGRGATKWLPLTDAMRAMVAQACRDARVDHYWIGAKGTTFRIDLQEVLSKVLAGIQAGYVAPISQNMANMIEGAVNNNDRMRLRTAIPSDLDEELQALQPPPVWEDADVGVAESPMPAEAPPAIDETEIDLHDLHDRHDIDDGIPPEIAVPAAPDTTNPFPFDPPIPAIYIAIGWGFTSGSIVTRFRLQFSKDFPAEAVMPKKLKHPLWGFWAMNAWTQKHWGDIQKAKTRQRRAVATRKREATATSVIEEQARRIAELEALLAGPKK